ncbi:hypothetical protein FGB62_75g021 [Gracilaria domingensis]|nr:hypothetical protein FGB62_75g021 [Gracilaria domingensis]
MISDSTEILKFLHLCHVNLNCQLYPEASAGAARYHYWSSVEKLEKFAHDNISMYYYFFGVVSEYEVQNVTKPYMKLVMHKSLMKVMPFLPSLASRANAFAHRRRVTPLLGADTIATEEITKVGLRTQLKRLEKCFKADDQLYFFGTAGPTAADFGIFAALKRLLHPIPELSPAFPAGYPDCLREVGDLRRLQAFFDNMNEKYY